MTRFVDIDKTASQRAKDAGLNGEAGSIEQSCPIVQMEIGVFFDGTLNNRDNALSGAPLEGSYQNALSNPALLYELYKDGDDKGEDDNYDEPKANDEPARTFRKVYVQGIGSTKDEADSRPGYVTGMGSTGIEARVVQGFEDLLETINAGCGISSISKVILDVFGFSRGAAAARYFVNCVRARGVLYAPLLGGGKVLTLPRDLKIEIRFVGIFDTVAAFGLIPNNSLNAPVNVHLNANQVTGRIYHLTARNEYRTNFRLNQNVPGGGDTFELLGAHSDVGGGYRDPGDNAPFGDEEKRYFDTRAEAEAAQAKTRQEDLAPGINSAEEKIFVAEGWMYPNEKTGGIVRHMTGIQADTIETHTGFGPPLRRSGYSYSEKKTLHRPWVKIGLSRIALHMMYEAAVAEVNGAFLEMPSNKEDYKIPDGLKPYEAKIRSGNIRGNDPALVYILRNYGHVSMKDGSLMNEDWWGHRPMGDHVRVKYPNKPGKAV